MSCQCEAGYLGNVQCDTLVSNAYKPSIPTRMKAAFFLARIPCARRFSTFYIVGTNSRNGQRFQVAQSCVVIGRFTDIGQA